jgi:hypothetical protein
VAQIFMWPPLPQRSGFSLLSVLLPLLPVTVIVIVRPEEIYYIFGRFDDLANLNRYAC